MINFSNILGTLMESGLSKSTTDRLKNAMSAGSEKAGDALSGVTDKISDLIDGTGGKNLGDMFKGVLGDAGRVLGENKNLALGGLGALAGALLGGGGKSVKGAIGGGVMAVLGAMAYKALKTTGQDNTEVPLGLQEPEDRSQETELEKGAELVLKAMINAAKADGKIDPTEVRRIIGKMEDAGESEEEREFLLAEMSKPLDMEGFIAEARKNPQLAPQLYAASLLAIEVDTPAEKAYMKDLAEKLNLDREVAADLERTMGLS